MAAAIGHNSRNQNVVRSNPEHGFTKLSNALLQDSRISYETRGLLVEILSRPDDWEITIAALVKSGPAGRDKVYRMMQEATKFGYAVARKDRRDDGTIRKHEYRVSDDPRLLIERAAAELDELLPEKAEVEDPDTVIPFPVSQEMARKQATSGKPGNGHPLPEKPEAAQPDTANPHSTNKRELQRKELTNGDARVRDPAPRENHLGRITAALAASIAGVIPAAAAPPVEPAAQVVQAPAECWQTQKAQMAAELNVNEKRAQHQVRVNPTGAIEVFGDFRAELLKTFPLVDLTCGLAVAEPNVRADRGALNVMSEIRRQFGLMQQRASENAKKAAAYQKSAPATAENLWAKHQKFYDGVQ
jgi:hypothetical protein